MPDTRLLSQHFILKLSVFGLFTLNESLHIFNFEANFVQTLLILDIFLVQDSVIVLKIFIFFGLEDLLLLQLLDSLLLCGEIAAEFSAILARFFECSLQMTVLFNLN